MKEKRPYVPPSLDDAINIGYRSNSETESILSNFADTPFILDGVEYANTEAFWQCLKFPEGSEKRDEVRQLSGSLAKKAVKKVPNPESVSYQGEIFKYGSKEHHALFKRALLAKFTDPRNTHAKELLLATGDSKITHYIIYPTTGEIAKDSSGLPRDVFTQMLMDIRDELRSSSLA